MDSLLPPGSMAHREYYLPDHLRGALQIHQTKTDGIISRLEKQEPGASYAALLDGNLDLPTMPKSLRDALGLVDAPVITDDMDTTDAAQAWADFANGDDR